MGKARKTLLRGCVNVPDKSLIEGEENRTRKVGVFPRALKADL